MPTWIKSYDLASGSYEQLARIYSNDKIRLSKLAQVDWMEPGSRVLYLGCGTGDEVVRAAQNGLEVTAIDLSSRMLARLAKRIEPLGLDIRLIEVDAFEFKEFQSFDYVAANFFFNIFNRESLPDILQHAIKLVKPGGGLLIAEIALPQGSLPGKIVNWTYINSVQFFSSMIGLVKLHRNHNYVELLSGYGWHLCNSEHFRVVNFGPVMFETLMFRKQQGMQTFKS